MIINILLIIGLILSCLFTLIISNNLRKEKLKYKNILKKLDKIEEKSKIPVFSHIEIYKHNDKEFLSYCFNQWTDSKFQWALFVIDSTFNEQLLGNSDPGVVKSMKMGLNEVKQYFYNRYVEYKELLNKGNKSENSKTIIL